MNWKFFKKLLLLPDNVEQIQLDINELKKDHKEIRESLIARGQSHISNHNPLNK